MSICKRRCCRCHLTVCRKCLLFASNRHDAGKHLRRAYECRNSIHSIGERFAFERIASVPLTMDMSSFAQKRAAIETEESSRVESR